ncbi:MAG TPA: hypothetical protein VEH86_05900 [Candidatus Acidoferrum sp.]|nr:hypothetical protein [Candidatus Acidoferrum sp.]
MLAKILVVIIVLAVNVACVLTIFSLVNSGTMTAPIYVTNLTYVNNDHPSSTYVSIAGMVVNPSSLAANNVTVLLDVYDQYVVPPVGSNNTYLGTVDARSSVSFKTNVSYSGYSADFDNGYYWVDYGLTLGSRFDFGFGFFIIVIPMVVLLPILDLYSGYKLGLFGWIKARKKLVVTTVVWAGVIALLVSLRFWLFYAGNPAISLSNSLDVYPQVYFWDWILVFILSIVAGAFVADLAIAVYSFVTTLILSSIFEFLFGSFYAWFDMGYGKSFSIIIPGLSFNSYLQSVLQDVLLVILHMINLAIPCFCALGVFIGVFLRSYFDPSIDV